MACLQKVDDGDDRHHIDKVELSNEFSLCITDDVDAFTLFIETLFLGGDDFGRRLDNSTFVLLLFRIVLDFAVSHYGKKRRGKSKRKERREKRDTQQGKKRKSIDPGFLSSADSSECDEELVITVLCWYMDKERRTSDLSTAIVPVRPCTATPALCMDFFKVFGSLLTHIWYHWPECVYVSQ